MSLPKGIFSLAYFCYLRKETSLMRSPFCPFVYLCAPNFQLLNQLTEFHETWYERYATGDCPKSYFFNFLWQAVITWATLAPLVWDPDMMWVLVHSFPSLMQTKIVQSLLYFKIPLKPHSIATCFGLTNPSSGNCSPRFWVALGTELSERVIHECNRMLKYNIMIYSNLFICFYSCCSLWNIGHLWNTSFRFPFLVMQTVGRTPWTGDEPVASHLPTQDNINADRHPCLEPTTPVFERAKIFHALDRAATVQLYSNRYSKICI
jgi:hypothetical protein